MIRLTFKPEYVDAIRSGRKDMTHRWKPVRGIKEGMLVAAVTRQGKRPAFLVPASARFATLRITRVCEVDLYNLTREDASRCGFTGYSSEPYTQEDSPYLWDEMFKFYVRCRPGLNERTLTRYEFEVVTEDDGGDILCVCGTQWPDPPCDQCVYPEDR